MCAPRRRARESGSQNLQARDGRSFNPPIERDANLASLVLDPFFRTAVESRLAPWRRVVAAAVSSGIPVPCLASALAWWDAYRSARLPANLLQAQRDYFGAHLFERLDRPRGEVFHEDWTGEGGDTTSQSWSD